MASDKYYAIGENLDRVQIDGMVGHWVSVTTWLGGNNYYDVRDDSITPDSIIDVYYSPATVDKLSGSNVTYTQTTGKLRINFENTTSGAFEAAVRIVNL